MKIHSKSAMWWKKCNLVKTRLKVWMVVLLVIAMTLADSMNRSSNVKETNSTTLESPYKIIVDGGSTGSRLHVFEFVKEDINELCVRRGSWRADIPLSAFGRLPSEQDKELNPTLVAEHLLPLFESAAEVIPPEFHAVTRVQYAATAGMRLLEEKEQEAVYDALYEGLMQAESFVFNSTQRKDIATLSGELEGFYGALAANYMQGIVDTKLRVIAQGETDDDQTTHSGPIGALDMGGSSTQIVFLPEENTRALAPPQSCPNDEMNEAKTCPANYSQQQQHQIKDEHFFSTSYLSYGVDQFRERLWSTLVQEQLQLVEGTDSCASKYIENPCANKGYTVEWEGFSLVGSGNTSECIRQTKRLIPHPEIPHDDHDGQPLVGGVEHPPVRGKFLAMSLYFFSLDSLRVFSKPNEEAHQALNNAWPNPSIEELHNALDGLCSRNWEDDMALQVGAHTFTREEVLPHRCIETVYMVTLLKDGFGFHPSSRDITFTFLVDGGEVEWTLGMALSMNAQQEILMEQEESGPPKQSPLINGTFKQERDEEDDQARFAMESLLPMRVLRSYFPTYFKE
eukprot:scaffold1830_cov117-Cylindrotheca_fusiformis.AAC.23